MKTAILTDSNSGITQSQSKELDIHVIPMPFMINGEEYLEDISLTQEKFYELLKDPKARISTSQPSTGMLKKEFDSLLETYDEVVFIPMSSGLSKTCESSKALAEIYNGKVVVVDNKRISITQRQSAIEAYKLAKKGYSAQEIKEILEATMYDSTIYIKVDTLEYLKKGGRLTPAAALLGSLLKIKPVLSIYGDKLDAYKKGRNDIQCKNIMIEAIKNDINKMGLKDDEYLIQVAYSFDESLAIKFKEELKQVFPNQEIYHAPLSLSVACHIGPNSLAIGFAKKLTQIEY